MSEQTFAIIKPNAVQQGHLGAMITQIEKAGFHIEALQLDSLSPEEAEALYQEHQDKPFYQELCDYITSGPVVLMVLKKEGAVAEFRALMGATDPKKAAPGTLRAQFGVSIDDNAVHGSDSPEAAARETALFFEILKEGPENS